MYGCEKEATDKVAIYRGPVLLAYDQRYNSVDPVDIPTLQPQHLRNSELIAVDQDQLPWIFLRVKNDSSHDLILCDFASAGAAGNPYCSWFSAKGFYPQPFSMDLPVWCASF